MSFWHDHVEPASALVESIEVCHRLLTPTEADVRISFLFREPVFHVEVRGKLVGPRCAYTTTVEVAYPLEMLPQEQPKALQARLVIPEPSLWEPACPFLYQGPVELWQGGRRLYAVRMSHGLRALQLGPRGLRWNGQPLMLRGAASEKLSEAEALRLHQAGSNTVLLPLPDSFLELSQASRQVADGESLVRLALGVAADEDKTHNKLDTADRYGFLVLARVPNNAEAISWVASLSDHTCFLGWLLPQELVEQEESRSAAVSQLGGRRGSLLGVELTRPPTSELPAEIAFICCREDLLPALGPLRQPRIVVTEREPPQESRSGILGWVRAVHSSS
jgi:hypothetical protein